MTIRHDIAEQVWPSARLRQRSRWLCVLGTLLACLLANLHPAVQPRAFFLELLAYSTLTICLTLAVSLGCLASIRLFHPDMRGIKSSEFYRRAVPEIVASRRRDGALLQLLCLPLVLSSYTTFKSLAFASSPYGFDQMFIELDRALFGGTDPWVLTHALFSSPLATQVLDWLYHPLFAPMLIGYVFCAVLSIRPDLRHVYILSYIYSWLIIGMVMAYFTLSGGPAYEGLVFADEGQFSALRHRLMGQEEQLGHISALSLQAYLSDAYTSGGLFLGTGISAMPSMHIALVMLWVLAAFRFGFWIGLATAIYGMIIWIASVHLAWHYAVDGLVAGVAVWIIWMVIRRLLGLRTSQME